MDLWQTPRPEPSLADLAGAAVPFPTWRKAPTPVRMLGGGELDQRREGRENPGEAGEKSWQDRNEEETIYIWWGS